MAALQVLRDRRGVGDTALAPGNRNALNSLIATHSVVVDATDGLIWVSESPHMLGSLRSFDLKDFLKRPGESAHRPSLDLPADPFLTSGKYERYLLFRDYLKMGEELAKKGFQEAALDYSKRALSMFPDQPEANLLAGRILLQDGKRKEAKHYLYRYLQALPSNPSEAESIRKLIEEGG
jgi:tetratricopeptide (TPR) repeat protein